MKVALLVMIAFSAGGRVLATDPATAPAQPLEKAEAAGLGLPENDAATAGVPDLLPKLNLLPAPPRRARLEGKFRGPKPTMASAQQGATEEIIRPIRASAMRSPMAVKILLDVESASTPELRRYLLRLYVSTICKRMRSQKPDLVPLITSFENAQIQMIYRSKSPHLTRSGTIEDNS